MKSKKLLLDLPGHADEVLYIQLCLQWMCAVHAQVSPRMSWLCYCSGVLCGLEPRWRASGKWREGQSAQDVRKPTTLVVKSVSESVHAAMFTADGDGDTQ